MVCIPKVLGRIAEETAVSVLSKGEHHMSRVALALAVAVAVWCPRVGRAETFVVPLPVNGSYVTEQQAPFSIDLGTTLIEVQEVRFSCEGSITAGVNYEGDPYSWSFAVWLPADPPGLWGAYGPLAGAATWPAAEPFAGEPVLGPVIPATWDFLLDGQATGWVELPEVQEIPELPSQQYPTGVLDQASLIIEATVPEPTTLWLIALGSLALLRRRP
jgi:hypothetical protein